MEVRQHLEQLRDHKELLQSLVKSPGWDLLVKNLSIQAKARGRECMLRPTVSIEDALRRNVQLGIILGLRLAVAMPTVIVDEKAGEIDSLLEEIRRATERDSE